MGYLALVSMPIARHTVYASSSLSTQLSVPPVTVVSQCRLAAAVLAVRHGLPPETTVQDVVTLYDFEVLVGDIAQAASLVGSYLSNEWTASEVRNSLARCTRLDASHDPSKHRFRTMAGLKQSCILECPKRANLYI